MNKQLLENLARILRALGIDPNKFAQKYSRDFVEKKMRRNLTKIVKGMESKGVTPSKFFAVDGVFSDDEKRICVRDALFRLWRAVLDFNGGGTVADRFFRDPQSEKVINAVTVTGTTTTAELVEAVLTATLDLTF